MCKEKRTWGLGQFLKTWSSKDKPSKKGLTFPYHISGSQFGRSPMKFCWHIRCNASPRLLSRVLFFATSRVTFIAGDNEFATYQSKSFIIHWHRRLQILLQGHRLRRIRLPSKPGWNRTHLIIIITFGLFKFLGMSIWLLHCDQEKWMESNAVWKRHRSERLTCSVRGRTWEELHSSCGSGIKFYRSFWCSAEQRRHTVDQKL